MSTLPARIAVTPGEPAGIGPDLIIQLAGQPRQSELVVIADPDLLLARARQLNLPLELQAYDAEACPQPGQPGQLINIPVAMAAPCTPGRLNTANGAYVLATLERATDGCLSGEFDAMLTAPVQKSVITESGTPFSGHTEYLADRCGASTPVMLLCNDKLRVALLTTHFALADVPAQITHQNILAVTRVLATGMQRLFGFHQPRIALLGLNPHAGEAGQLGREELEIITPAITLLRNEGLDIIGPLPADSAFTPAALENFDVVLAMYHDQGLPVLKHAGFGNAVNVTLGLPIIRTSVDHGTALDLAGTGTADSGSLQAALALAEHMHRTVHGNDA